MRRYNKADKDEAERHVGLLKWAQILSFFLVFVAGIVIGIATSSHISRLYFSPQSELYSFVNHVSSAPVPEEEEEVKGYHNCGGTIQECEVINCLNFETFLHPPNLTHNLMDDELFWRASLVPKKEEYPSSYKRVPKVAFMFLTRGPLPLLPLWERFFKGHEDLFNIYVHAPPGYNMNVSNSSAFYGRQIPSQDVSWGSATLTDAERRLLANALLDFSNERFILLSESCIPVYDFPTVYKYLTGSALSFVDSYDEPTRYGRGRYSRHMLPHIHLRHWRKGSQWFELNRELAVHIISDTNYYKLFCKFCKPACYPDEHYIPTYLNMFHGSLNSNRTVTWVDWSQGGPHPATFGGPNITVGFIQSIRNSGTLCQHNSEITSVCYLFARKFDPSALEPLLNISMAVMGF
ncbi:glycosyltransferase BC10-like isoform X1 [Prosopis cineraria]|uniref:glycosyltransferase BC10-like isoform X1 n=1 Tax=Prosopis cineraria TaxID=364024 RepID=UPI00240ED347|nr:glycosyltransferase BC10-like isoform X1 [Prosopis cineraria]